MLNVDSIIAVRSDQVSCDLDGETAILQLTDGVYYSLDEVGTRVWELIQNPIRVRDLCDQLVTEFEVELDQCAGDIIELVGELEAAGLVRVTAE